jgi:hypothetical protein
MPPRKRKRHIVMTEQQAQGFFGDLAKKALKAALPLIKKEAKKALPKLGKLALKKARKTKAGRKLGFGAGKGLRLAGQRGRGPRGKQVRKRRRKAQVRVVMI